MTTNPTRQPAGATDGAGGQFAPSATTEAPVQLWGDRVGSFAFPERIPDYDQFVQFWTTVDVPDENKRVFRDNYDVGRETAAQTAVQAWADDNPEPRVPGTREHAQWEQTVQMVHAQALEQWPPIPEHMTRQLAQLQRMFSRSNDLATRNPDGTVNRTEVERLLNRRFVLSDGSSGTLRAYVRKYHLDRVDGLTQQRRTREEELLLEVKNELWRLRNVGSDY